MTGENVAHRHQIFSQLNFSGLQILESIPGQWLKSDAEIVDGKQIISGLSICAKNFPIQRRRIQLCGKSFLIPYKELKNPRILEKFSASSNLNRGQRSNLINYYNFLEKYSVFFLLFKNGARKMVTKLKDIIFLKISIT